MVDKSMYKRNIVAFGDNTLLKHFATVAHGTSALVHAMTCLQCDLFSLKSIILCR